MQESITVRFSIHASAKAIYDAWLDSAKHSAMTGSPAIASRQIGGKFSAWEGYITGTNLLLLEGKKIVQSWRSSEFPEEAADSVLSVLLIEREGITEVELEHKDIPRGQGVQYQSGWIEFYANPMQKYFSSLSMKGTAGKKAPSPKHATVRKKSIAKKPGQAARKGAKAGTKPVVERSKKSAVPVKSRRATVKKKVVRPKRTAKKALRKGR